MSEIKVTGQPAWRPTPSDMQSSAWANLMGHLKQRLEDLRQDLEKDTSEEATAKTRGRIAEVKRLMELSKPLPATQ